MSPAIDAFVTTATGTTVVPASRTGVVEIDVTADVRNFKADPSIVNHGWLLKTGFGNGGEVADIDCVPGTPAAEGTACGSGLACNATGDCVPTP